MKKTFIQSDQQIRYRAVIAVVALMVVGLYLGLAAGTGEAGLPLDDGWIHQTYARNLARTGNWEFVPGEVSAGSTAPLWTILLAVGYLLKLPFLFWTYLLGWICLVWLGWAAMDLWGLLWPARSRQGWLAAAVLVLTWPMVWAAVSGMETLLFMALGFHLIVYYGRYLIWNKNIEENSTPDNSLQRQLKPVVVLGLLSGLLILTRPDGLGLLLLITVGLILTGGTVRERVILPTVFILTTLLLLIPYFVFNYSSSGTLWPNTFYAKQAEYAFLWGQNVAGRFFQLLYYSLGGPAEGLQGISGVHFLLLPGLILSGWLAIKKDWQQKRLWLTLPLLWAAGHILLYAWRLPVTYQHGRYLWAAVPVWTLFGLAGWQDLTKTVLKRLVATRFRFVWRMVTMLTFALLLLAFLLIGGDVYAFDVGVINGEMVTVARWLDENTSPDALIAAHDIGAIGYFAERPLLDLAGLISPEVIDLLSSEAELSEYILDSSAEYLVTAPGWTYPTLTNSQDTTLLFKTDYLPTIEQGLNNMAVYDLHQP